MSIGIRVRICSTGRQETYGAGLTLAVDEDDGEGLGDLDGREVFDIHLVAPEMGAVGFGVVAAADVEEVTE